jgi:DNA sulfur modification protein DndB
MRDSYIRLRCIRGQSASRSVLLGFASARVLHALSFADVLDEDSGRGYQRRFNAAHSLDFRRYIQRPNSTTIPLTFNLRPADDSTWRLLERSKDVELQIRPGMKVLAQVDCQHRLGHLDSMDTSLPFMCFIGLSAREEMEIFNVINSKAKGLSASLLDFHDAQLSKDLGSERPELFIALFLKNDARSPWHQQLDLGGRSTSGTQRRASLRTMQKAIRQFLTRTRILELRSVEEAAVTILDFWIAVSLVLAQAWTHPRKHLVNKGVGVYALMEIAADIFNDSKGSGCDRKAFIAAMNDFAAEFDWSTGGPLKGLGGEGGVKEAVRQLRNERRKRRMKVVSNG